MMFVFVFLNLFVLIFERSPGRSLFVYLQRNERVIIWIAGGWERRSVNGPVRVLLKWPRLTAK